MPKPNTSLAPDVDIEKYLVRYRQIFGIPGLCVGIADPSRTARAWSLGLANIELDVPATVDTVYKLGSVSKQILAAGVMLLVQEGTISLNDTVSKYLSQSPLELQDITIAMLLSHTSGLRRDPVRQQFFSVGSLDDVVYARENWALIGRPGTLFSYSNLGYFFLGYVIERVAAESFATFFENRFFKKLGMFSTRTTSAYDIIRNRSASYFVLGDIIQNAGDLRQFRPSGAFLSTVADMLLWDRSLRDATILSRQSLARMSTPLHFNEGKINPYGLGWYVFDGASDRILFHSGGLWSFRSNYVFFVRSGISVIVLANCRETNTNAIVKGILSIIAPDSMVDWAKASS